MIKKLLPLLALTFLPFMTFAQEKSDLGSWYMYFGNLRFTESPWAIHLEAQYRNHNIIGDLEQFFARTGLQYNLPDGSASFLSGYGLFITQAEGEPNMTFLEHRVYQEAILRHKVGRVGLMHRFRYEQRWIENQDFRTRFRYAIFVNVPLNDRELTEKGSWYIQLYDELFVNGEKPNENIEYFDRNRIYLGLGYRTSPQVALQFGLMEQTNDVFSKTQLQFSMFHQMFTR